MATDFFLPEQILIIYGLIDPILEAIEGILRYFRGYLKLNIEFDDNKIYPGETHLIRSHNNLFAGEFSYLLVNWEFVSLYYNRNLSEQIKSKLSIENFK